MMIHRRTLLATPLLACLARPAQASAPAAAKLSAQDQTDLTRVEGYLNGMKAITARFLQVAPDGAVSQGNAWLQRPGNMRFEYDKPAPYLMVAGFGSFVFYDSELNQTTSIPLRTTPLSILLAEKVELKGDVTVTNIDRQPGVLQVTMVRSSSPEDGSLTLVFADQPLALRQWVVTDGQHQETTVSLYDIEPGGPFPARMFEFHDPRLQDNRQN
ncbi:MAG: outer membrane lipoprotein carrier protein LolA [Acetobacteraceae bacterium]|nr:outer membrane lipoprotein carrier protein LolA [Acetobacteraceae bacterium]